jgi:hypothetical protein
MTALRIGLLHLETELARDAHAHLMAAMQAGLWRRCVLQPTVVVAILDGKIDATQTVF